VAKELPKLGPQREMPRWKGQTLRSFELLITGEGDVLITHEVTADTEREKTETDKEERS
jgi:hypothetical protein